MTSKTTPKNQPTTPVVPAPVPVVETEKRARYPRNPALAPVATEKTAREFQQLVLAMRALKLGVPRNFVRKTFTVAAKGMDPETAEPLPEPMQAQRGAIALKELRDFINATPRVKQALVAAKKIPAQ